MALKNQQDNVYSVGLRNVGSYQVSGTPYMTGSTNMTLNKTLRHTFPYVTKSITVICTHGANDIRVHFHPGVPSPSISGDGLPNAGGYATGDSVQGKHHYTTVPSSNGSVTFDVKVKEIYITSPAAASSYEIFAELTQIPTSRMYALSGTGIEG